MKNLKRNQNILLSVHILRTILELFIDTFLTSYILSFSPDSVLGSGLINVGLFYATWFAVYILSYFILSYFVDRSNRVSFLKIGILVNALLLSALVLWGETISKWIILAGSLCGISHGFYYSSYMVLRNELNSNSSLKPYNISVVIFTNIVKIIVPTVLGALIDVSSYRAMAIYVIAIAIAQFILSFFIKAKKPENSKFELRKYFSYLKENKDVSSKIKYTYINSFLSGFKETYKVIIVILLIYTFKTNLSLGIFTSAFSIITILLLLAYKQIDNHPKVNKFAIYMLIGILPFLSCLCFVLFMNKWTLIIYNFFLTVAIYFSDYFGSIERDAIIKFTGHDEFVSEHQFVGEFLMGATRVISYILLIVVGIFENILIFKILLVLFLSTNPIKFFVLYKQRMIRKNYEQTASNEDSLQSEN